MKITCPHCEQRIEAPYELAGTSASCPTCHNEIVVSNPAGEPKPAPPTPEPEPANLPPSTPPADSPILDLPNPTDHNILAALEAQIQEAIGQLAENSRLMRIVTTSPWDWNPAEIREQASAADARRLVLTKIGALLGRRQKRIMDANFRMRFSHGDTLWDTDFGQPTSVLRVEFHVPGDERDGRKRWNPGVTVGKIASNRFLVWEWGE